MRAALRRAPSRHTIAEQGLLTLLTESKTMQTTKKLYHSVKENLRPLLMRGKKLGRRAASQRRKPKKECVSEKIHLIFAKM